MSSEVKRYSVRGQFDRGLDLTTTQKVVLAADYAALEAECARLKNSLLAITARHFAESWNKRTSDAELEQYLSAGIAQLEAERDALHAENETLRDGTKRIDAYWQSELRDCRNERDALAAELDRLLEGRVLDAETISALEQELKQARDAYQNIIDQTTPLEPVPGDPRWSKRIELDEVIAERDQLRSELAQSKRGGGE